MAFTDIDNSELNFQTKTFSGNAGTNAITLDGSENMQPDWVWLKKRNGTANHHLVDSVRGAGRYVFSNLSNAEGGDGADGGGNDLLASFNSDGFTLDAGADSNASSATGVGWCWKAGGSASSNSDGSITSSVSANTTAGFSIVSYTATGSTATIGHGLGAVPNWILTKKRAGGSNRDWAVYHAKNTSAPETEILYLNNTDATADSSPYWNDTAPTSSVFTVGAGNEVNESSGNTYIAYCFAEKKGYSKFGSYTGNNNTDGSMIFTGFKPAWVMVKSTTSTDHWRMHDNKRISSSGTAPLYPHLNNAEPSANFSFDLLSNGFKWRNQDGDANGSHTYIYMAFAESPFVNSNGVPNNAE